MKKIVLEYAAGAWTATTDSDIIGIGPNPKDALQDLLDTEVREKLRSLLRSDTKQRSKESNA